MIFKKHSGGICNMPFIRSGIPGSRALVTNDMYEKTCY